jgi:phosphate transport system substrate-binding protein
VLVQGVSRDPLALGFFGYAYYAENKDKLKAVAIDDNDPKDTEGPVAPSPETVANGTYQPLSRPVFIYVALEAATRPEVQELVQFYLDRGRQLAEEVGYVALPQRAYELARQRFVDRATGSVFGGEGSRVGVTIQEMLEKER